MLLFKKQRINETAKLRNCETAKLRINETANQRNCESYYPKYVARFPSIRPFVYSSIRPFVYSSIRPFVYSSIRPFVYSSIRPFVYLRRFFYTLYKPPNVTYHTSSSPTQRRKHGRRRTHNRIEHCLWHVFWAGFAHGCLPPQKPKWIWRLIHIEQ